MRSLPTLPWWHHVHARDLCEHRCNMRTTRSARCERDEFPVFAGPPPRQKNLRKLRLSNIRHSRFRRAPPQQLLLALVACKPRCRLERGARFGAATEILQEIAADALKQMIVFQRRLVDQTVHDLERGVHALRPV